MAIPQTCLFSLMKRVKEADSTVLLETHFLFFDYICAHVSTQAQDCKGACTSAHECHTHGDQKRVGIIRSCEPPNIGAGNQTLVLCQSSVCSSPLIHLPSLIRTGSFAGVIVILVWF